MTTTPQLLVHDNAEALAAASAARLVTTVLDTQAARGSASIALTGGGIGIAVLTELARSAATRAVDWERLDVFWGDDRFVPAGDAERNEKQAREALLDHVPADPRRIHPMPPSDGEFAGDPDAAAEWYERRIGGHGRTGRGESATAETGLFDVVLLGVGGEGHVASIFPDSPAVRETERLVVAVRDCPKPPPTRVSLSLPAIRSATEVWVIASGAGKADVLADAYAGAPETRVPVAGARGRAHTRWLLDRDAAAGLPR
ncbi:6-phosphogluconolactonase [Haloechinothrix alba]|uniref:6-phosphogluconolactonase n=1 Tax=Haloechinothrix alba TaxID=664784 RepID=A0A238WX44_9PSEU|nr:6-phosphogluconolactonase [Haloechinothrix alba]SNR51070.1 6-phosphogluconolactonase [Haloechinothrix alba]